MERQPDAIFEVLTAGVRLAEGEAGLAAHVFAYRGSVPLGDGRWNVGVLGVPDSTLLIEAAAVVRGLAMTPERARVRLYLTDKRLLTMLFGPMEHTERFGLGSDLRGRARQLARRRQVEVDLVGHGETPELERLAVVASRAASDSGSCRDWRALWRELMSAGAGSDAWFRPRSVLKPRWDARPPIPGS